MLKDLHPAGSKNSTEPYFKIKISEFFSTARKIVQYRNTANPNVLIFILMQKTLVFVAVVVAVVVVVVVLVVVVFVLVVESDLKI